MKLLVMQFLRPPGTSCLWSPTNHTHSK